MYLRKLNFNIVLTNILIFILMFVSYTWLDAQGSIPPSGSAGLGANVAQDNPVTPEYKPAGVTGAGTKDDPYQMIEHDKGLGSPTTVTIEWITDTQNYGEKRIQNWAEGKLLEEVIITTTTTNEFFPFSMADGKQVDSLIITKERRPDGSVWPISNVDRKVLKSVNGSFIIDTKTSVVKFVGPDYHTETTKNRIVYINADDQDYYKFSKKFEFSQTDSAGNEFDVAFDFYRGYLIRLFIKRPGQPDFEWDQQKTPELPFPYQYMMSVYYYIQMILSSATETTEIKLPDFIIPR